LKVDSSGSLYYLARGSISTNGQVVRIDFVPGSDTDTPASIAQAQALLCRLRRLQSMTACE
jgi:hypothetical protein